MAGNDINHVVLVGNLTKDPELKEVSNGNKVCELRVAVNSSFKRGDTWESKPNYFQVSAWGAAGENAAKFLEKGSKVGISGRLEWQSWTSQDGGLNSRVVIIAQNVQFLTPKGQKPEPVGDAPASDDTSSDDPDDIPF